MHMWQLQKSPEFEQVFAVKTEDGNKSPQTSIRWLWPNWSGDSSGDDK